MVKKRLLQFIKMYREWKKKNGKAIDYNRIDRGR